jgi:hypothetical protein
MKTAYEKVLLKIIFPLLYPNAFNGYVNSIKSQPKTRFWYFRKLMTVEVCCYFWTKPGGFNRSDLGMKQMLLHLLEDLIILIIIQVILISKLILSCYFNGRWGQIILLILSN